MIIFLSIIQIILCIVISGVIVMSKPASVGISSITNNFNGGGLNSKFSLRLRPISKIMLFLILLFFLNSIILAKAFKEESEKFSVAGHVSKDKIASNNSTTKEAPKKNNDIPFE